MAQAPAYTSAWDDNNSFGDYLALEAHLAPSTAILPSDFYHFDYNEHVDSPLTSPEPELPQESRVKQEDTQDDFIFEAPAPSDAPAVPAFSSMTEVPLRATQATKEMRRMMTVFRLDPFTMHNAVRDPTANLTWNGEPIGPLKEKPTMHEFQLELLDRVKAEPSPVLHRVLLDEHDRLSSSRRHGSSPTPSPPHYDSLDSPSLSPLDNHEPSCPWSESSSEPPSLGYSPALIQSEPYNTVMTPADGIAVGMNINLSSRYSAHSCKWFF